MYFMTKMFLVIYMSNVENKPKNKPMHSESSSDNLEQAVKSNELTEKNLVRLLSEIRDEKEQNDVVEHKPFSERVLEKKGVFNLLYKKMPLRYIGISSFSQTNKTIMDSYASFRSPTCPKCCAAILMYNKRLSYRDGTVDWFCADNKCGFTLRYSSTGAEIKEHVQELSLSLNSNRWSSLSEDEKEQLISSHFSKAFIYRNIAMLFSLVLIAELMFGMWMVAFMTGALVFSIFMRALYWCYRAYQIKTGKVFDKRIPFTDWITTAAKWFSVEWGDGVEDNGDSNE